MWSLLVEKSSEFAQTPDLMTDNRASGAATAFHARNLHHTFIIGKVQPFFLIASGIRPDGPWVCFMHADNNRDTSRHWAVPCGCRRCDDHTGSCRRGTPWDSETGATIAATVPSGSFFPPFSRPTGRLVLRGAHSRDPGKSPGKIAAVVDAHPSAHLDNT